MVTERHGVSKKVRAFYENCSFPGYEEFDTPLDLVEKAKRGIYAELLEEQLPLGIRVLDAGCGTGQLAIFLSLVHRQVVGVDFSYNSLQKANTFKTKFALRDVHLAQMDLFYPALKEKSFDYVFCNGVLHHTADARRGFDNLCRLLKPGGYIAIGLYNTYGRLLLNLRRGIFNVTRDRLKCLDFFMRQKSVGEEKRDIWFKDQYRNPHDTTFTVGDVLKWFQQNDIEYISSLPKIKSSDHLSRADRLFEPQNPGTSLDHFLCQLGWIFSKGTEGGFFITVGRKT
jgi:SAM-dependent methyltransferase